MSKKPNKPNSNTVKFEVPKTKLQHQAYLKTEFFLCISCCLFFTEKKNADIRTLLSA